MGRWGQGEKIDGVSKAEGRMWDGDGRDAGQRMHVFRVLV